MSSLKLILLMTTLVHLTSSCFKSYVPDSPQKSNSDFKDVRFPWYNPLWLKSDGSEPWESYTSSNKKYYSKCQCGIHNVTEVLTPRIVGGTEAAVREFPWQALLLVARSDGQSLCGGTIINDKIILTAAHCVIDLKSGRPYHPKQFQVFIDVHSLVPDPNLPNRIQVGVAEIKFHPRFIQAVRFGYFDYDIALLRLEKRLAFSDSGTPIPVCLQSKPSVSVIGLRGTVIGWGLTDPDNDASVSRVLQKVEVQIHPLSMCKDIVNPLTPITEHFICAGSFNQSQDPSRGDSGGPLMTSITKDHHQLQQVGLVSWGDYDIPDPYGNIRNNSVVLYTKISDFLNYIEYFSDFYQSMWCPP